MALTKEQIKRIDCNTYFHESADWSERFARAIEAAATAPLLERIAHLEATASANYGRGQADAHSMLSERIAKLEQELSEARKDAQIIRNQALEDAAKCCDGLHAPESCSQVESSLWDVATLAAGDAIRAMKKEQP